MNHIAIINGPNLNLLGRREPVFYGTNTLQDIEEDLKNRFSSKTQLSFFQSNHEGALIDHVQQLSNISGIVINPGALTHTSIALRDTLVDINIPSIEVHLSNIYKREPFRRHSYFSDVCLGVISGLGPRVYGLAVQALITMNDS
jgi:3-dehydroquinate dehydratase II